MTGNMMSEATTEIQRPVPDTLFEQVLDWIFICIVIALALFVVFLLGLSAYILVQKAP